MAEIKGHAIWKRKFRGSTAMLRACIDLTMHLTSAKIKHAWEEEAYYRYQGFNTNGWVWPHMQQLAKVIVPLVAGSTLAAVVVVAQ